jgi:hypothetical protein
VLKSKLFCFKVLAEQIVGSHTKENGLDVHCFIALVEISSQKLLEVGAIGVCDTEIICRHTHEGANPIFV